MGTSLTVIMVSKLILHLLIKGKIIYLAKGYECKHLVCKCLTQVFYSYIATVDNEVQE